MSDQPYRPTFTTEDRPTTRPGHRLAELDSVDLGDGVRGVVVDIIGSAEAPAYLIEVFLARGSMGDGVVAMVEAPDGSLMPDNPSMFAEILRGTPNLDTGA